MSTKQLTRQRERERVLNSTTGLRDEGGLLHIQRLRSEPDMLHIQLFQNKQ